MGGENEKPLRTTKDAGSAPSKDLKTNIGMGRIHEDGGQVHLHEGGPGDKTKLKVAIPTYVYWDRLTKWVSEGMTSPLVFVDTVNSARCIITPSVENINPEGLDVSMSWSKINIVGNLKALVEHAEAR